MDYEKLNPCKRARFAQLFAWLATDCWCCSGLRAVAAIGLPLLWLGHTLPVSKFLNGVLATASFTGVVIVAALALLDREEPPK